MKAAVGFEGEAVAIGRREDFGAGLHAVVVHGVALIVVRRRGRLAAAVSRCPHAGRRLDDAVLKGWRLTCPGHGFSWDVRPRRRGAVTLEHVRIGETPDGTVLVALADLTAAAARLRRERGDDAPDEADGRVDL